MWGFVDANTSGVPFLLWAIAGGVSAVFIISQGKTLLIDLTRMYLIFAVAGVWFIASDVIKKKGQSNPKIHFLFDSIFYTILFSVLIFMVHGYDNGLFFIGILPLISAPLFSNLLGGTIFAFFFSVMIFLSGHLPTGLSNLKSYDIGFLVLQTVFCVVLVAIVRFFMIEIKKADREKLSFAQKEVDKKTRELRKTFDSLRTQDEQLRARSAELEQFQELMVGRELKMAELKSKLAETSAQLKEMKEKYETT